MPLFGRRVQIVPGEANYDRAAVKVQQCITNRIDQSENTISVSCRCGKECLGGAALEANNAPDKGTNATCRITIVAAS
ncbi:hypothetical protein AMTR_s00007p00260250 [Amborella trichopoda]|uniref:Uncharacterized protein n=1 Tax=Amborella trichopoda TaxID=13333 RepID=W1PC37_AMBTC|nr:hypothetical protein AMTR_s00007p00260250 [Amborella trichopoda]